MGDKKEKWLGKEKVMATICKGCKAEVLRSRWIENVGWFCMECAPEAKIIGTTGKSRFPFSTWHLNPEKPEKITVRSLRHLRQLENQYGVASVAWNTDEKNWHRPEKRDMQ
jgi:hypothetical protein